MHVIPKRQSYACRVCANLHVIEKKELEIEHHGLTRMKELMSKVRISRRLFSMEDLNEEVSFV